MKTRDLTMAAMFIAMGVLLGNIIYIPVGASKCFPIQHAVNVLSAVLLGPGYAVGNAFCISLLRNILGTGTLLAFPGSMVGALVAGVMYRLTKNNMATAVGEVFGTGVLGGLLSMPMAVLMMGKEVGVFAYVPAFLMSSFGGAVIALLLLKSTELVKASQQKAS